MNLDNRDDTPLELAAERKRRMTYAASQQLARELRQQRRVAKRNERGGPFMPRTPRMRPQTPPTSRRTGGNARKYPKGGEVQ